jgi:adenylate kinase
VILIPLGPPGSGKGTQAKRISSKLGLAHLSTGDMFRAAIQQGTEMGMKAKSFMDKGELVPDTVTIGLIADRIQGSDCKKGFILDGFPRTVAQAEALGELLKKRNTPVDAVVLFEIPDSELIGRLSGRRICSKCGAMYHLTASPPKKADVCDQCGTTPLTHRSDDQIDVIKNRLSVYHNQTAPLIDFYKKSGKFHSIDATRSPDEVEKQLQKFL